jgi:hypothetical protein
LFPFRQLCRHGPCPFWTAYTFEARLGDVKQFSLLVGNNRAVEKRAAEMTLQRFLLFPPALSVKVASLASFRDLVPTPPAVLPPSCPVGRVAVIAKIKGTYGFLLTGTPVALMAGPSAPASGSRFYQVLAMFCSPGACVRELFIPRWRGLTLAQSTERLLGRPISSWRFGA